MIYLFLCSSMDPIRAYEKERDELLNDLHSLGNELSGAPQAKVVKIVATDAFERAKASASYGIIGDIHYRIILPLKKIIGLTPEQEKNLELYNKHKALCSGIQKVQASYKAYIAAQKAADNAPSTPNFLRIGARFNAAAAGNSLVNDYKDLIKLAIDQAEKLGEDKTEYLSDLHSTLEKENYGYIFDTVNTIRPKSLESGWLGSDSRKHLRNNYLSFVTQYVLNVRDARLQCGNSSVLDDGDIVDISNAFIQGLAAIPELGELDGADRHLVLIEFYDALTGLQDPFSLAEAQNGVIAHFRAHIEALMNKPQEITTGDLEEIQHLGISLVSVLGVDQLNELKTLKEYLQEVQNVISKTEAKIQEKQQVIAESISYSFSEVQEFLGGNAKFEDIPNDEAIVGNFATSYREALKKYTDLKQLKESTESTPQAKAARIQAITDNRAAVTETKEEIARLAGVIKTEVLELGSKEKELQDFENEIEENARKIASEIGSDRIKKVKMTSFREECAKEITAMQNEIKQLQNSSRTNRDAKIAEKKRLTELEKTVEGLILQGEQEAQTLQGLDASIKELQVSTIGSLSGKEIVALATHLGIKRQVDSESSIALQINGVQAAGTRVTELTNNLGRKQNQAKTVSDKIFVLNATMFGDQERAKIEAQIKSNLVIAKKVTMEVGRKLEKQDNDSARLKAEKDMGSSHISNRIYATYVSPLKIPLDEREKELNEDSLVLLVSEGMEKLAPVVEARRLPVSLKVDLSDEDEFFSMESDEENWGDMGINEV